MKKIVAFPKRALLVTGFLASGVLTLLPHESIASRPRSGAPASQSHIEEPASRLLAFLLRLQEVLATNNEPNDALANLSAERPIQSLLAEYQWGSLRRIQGVELRIINSSHVNGILAAVKAEQEKLDEGRRDIVTELGQVVNELIESRTTKSELPKCGQDVGPKDRIECLTRILALVRGKLSVTEKEEDKKKLGEVPGTAVGLESFSLGSITAVGGKRKRVIDDVDIFVSQAHDRYKELKRMAKPHPELRAAVRDLRTLVHKLLEARGRHNRLSAVLRSGYVRADPGDDSRAFMAPPAGGSEAKELFTRRDGTTSNDAAAFVEWETKHFLDEEFPIDFSIGGKFGFVPVLSIVQERPSGTTTDTDTETMTTTTTADGTTTTVTETTTTTVVSPNQATGPIFPFYQQGFGWDLRWRANIHVMDEAELSPFVRIGQTRVDSFTTQLDESDDAKLADLVDNDRGKWAFVHEYGVEFRYYDASMDEKHDELGLLMPIFRFEVGVRTDERFHPGGLLSDLPSPEDRWFLRSSINLRELFDRRVSGAQSKALEVRFAVEREWARRGDSIPSGTTILIEASADLLKLIQPTSTAPSNE